MLGLRVVATAAAAVVDVVVIFSVASDAALNYLFDGFCFFCSDYSENIYRFGLIPFELWMRMDMHIFEWPYALHHTLRACVCFNQREREKTHTFPM